MNPHNLCDEKLKAVAETLAAKIDMLRKELKQEIAEVRDKG